MHHAQLLRTLAPREGPPRSAKNRHHPILGVTN